jgi:hypothetical protein
MYAARQFRDGRRVVGGQLLTAARRKSLAYI